MGQRASRHTARQRALNLLYAADLNDRAVETLLAGAAADDEDPLPAFTAELVRGVDAHRAELDRLIVDHAKDWRLERMPVVDRNVLRLGVYELLHEEDLSSAVVIDEAVELAKGMSTDNSARFVNGVLEAVRRSRGQQADTSG